MSCCRFLWLSCALLIVAAPGRAESILYLQGDPQDLLWATYAAGYGTARSENTDDNGSFTYSLTNWCPECDVKQTIEVAFRRDDTRYTYHNDWSLTFSPPRQSAFELRLYEPAARFPFHSGGEAGLTLSSATFGCNKSGGWFQVLELEASGSMVNKLAIDFMHICEPGTNAVHETFEDPETHELTFTSRDARLYGSLRINSEIAVVPAPPAGWLLLSAVGPLMMRRLRFRNRGHGRFSAGS